MKRKKTNKQKRHLSIEKLQKRELMAGDVTAYVTGGNLVISGDNSANSIEVYQKYVGSSTWYVDGVMKAGVDTTVNGRTAPQIFRGVYDDIRIYTKGGNDRIEMDKGRVRDQLYIRTGSGNDDVILENISTGRDVNIDLGRRYSNTVNDYVWMQGVKVGDDIRVRGSRGRDVVIVSHCDVKDDIVAHTGSGNDYVRIERTDADYFYAKLGSGNDTAILDDDDFNRTYVNGESGSDRLILRDRGGDLGRFSRRSIGLRYE